MKGLLILIICCLFLMGLMVEHIRNTIKRPSVQFRPRLGVDGNQWFVLYGENLQDGIAGFGNTPELAMLDFDRNWKSELPMGKLK